MLGAERYGLYQYINTNIQFMIMLFGLNASSGLVVFSSRANISLAASNKLALKLLLFGGSLTLILLFSFSAIDSLRHFLIPSEYTGIYWFIFFFLSYLFQKGTIFLESLMKGHAEFSKYNKGTFSNSVLATALYGAGFVLFRSDTQPIYLFSLILIVQLMSMLIMLILWQNKRQQPVNDPEQKKQVTLGEYWSYMRAGYASYLTRFVNKRLSVWLIRFFEGLAPLGCYQLAASFNQFVLDAIQPASQMLMKYLHPDTLEKERYIIHVRMLGSAVLIGSCILIILFPYIIPWLFGEAYHEAIRPAQILGITSYFVFLTNNLSLYNYTHQRLRFSWFAQLIGLAVTIVLDFILIPVYGIIGAAWACFISYGSTALYMLLTVPRAMNLPIHQFLMPSRSDLKRYFD